MPSAPQPETESPTDEVVQVFHGDTLEEAMAGAVAELGPDLAVRRARKVRSGVRGLMGQDRYEVLAVPGPQGLPRHDPGALDAALDALLDAADRDEAGAPAPTRPVPPRPAPGRGGPPVPRVEAALAPASPHPSPAVAEHPVASEPAVRKRPVRGRTAAEQAASRAAGEEPAPTRARRSRQTAAPTGEPTAEPTGEPTGEPTAEPTGERTATPTAAGHRSSAPPAAVVGRAAPQPTPTGSPSPTPTPTAAEPPTQAPVEAPVEAPAGPPPAPAARAPRATARRAPGWSRAGLVAVGVPAAVLEALPAADPADDLAWVSALTAAIAATVPEPREAGPGSPVVVDGHGSEGAVALLDAGVRGVPPGTLTVDGRRAPATALELALAVRAAVLS